MNCPCYGLPVTTCTPHHKDNICSTCHPKNCYAQRNMYNFLSVKNALAWRERQINNHSPSELKEAFTKVIGHQKLFRFFDSGDFIDRQMMNIVLDACEACPDTKVWIPTKRYDLVEALRQTRFEEPNPVVPLNMEPDNVCLRVGVWQIDPTDDTVDAYRDSFGCIAIVVKERTRLYDDAIICKAPHEAQCGIDCTACFEKDVPLVVYKWH